MVVELEGVVEFVEFVADANPSLEKATQDAKRTLSVLDLCILYMATVTTL